MLCPTLFLIYINHISTTLVSNIKLFADDLKLYPLIRPQNLNTVLQCISTVQKDIDSLVTVAELWDLKINAKKLNLLVLVPTSVSLMIWALIHFTPLKAIL